MFDLMDTGFRTTNGQYFVPEPFPKSAPVTLWGFGGPKSCVNKQLESTYFPGPGEAFHTRRINSFTSTPCGVDPTTSPSINSKVIMMVVTIMELQTCVCVGWVEKTRENGEKIRTIENGNSESYIGRW